MKTRLPLGKESRFELTISYLLVTGVAISLLLEIAGVIAFYLTFRNLSVSQNGDVFIQGHDFFTFTLKQLSGTAGQKLPFVLLTAGIVVLILTPYIRVVASVVHFMWEKDWKYVFITLFVLTVVTISLTLH